MSSLLIISDFGLECGSLPPPLTVGKINTLLQTAFSAILPTGLVKKINDSKHFNITKKKNAQNDRWEGFVLI